MLAIDPSIFRSYDIRGIVGPKSLNAESVLLIGAGFGSMLQENGGKLVVIGRDGRLSSPELARALAEGLQQTGCEVIDLNSVPTPLLYYAIHHLKADAGIMLTGSHNPPEYNGLKMVLHGVPLAEARIHELYQRIQRKLVVTGQGSYKEYDIVDRYIKEVTQFIYLPRPLHIVIDASHGITGEIAPKLFRALGCEVEELYCTVDGRFPAHQPDPSQPENLQDLIALVKKTRADIGLAFDGDGDRLGVVTDQGEIIWPDRLLMLYAKTVLAEAPDATIIYDVKCTHHLATLIHALGGRPLMWKTGHSLIKAKLAEVNALLAGEMSGHFFFKDRWYGFDDGLYAGARLLEILANQHEESSALFAQIPNSINTPELKISVGEEEKFLLMQQLIAAANFDNAEVMTIDGLRVNFGEGWGLLRPSNTSPCLILRFEALNQRILDEIQTIFRHWMLTVKPDWVLPF